MKYEFEGKSIDECLEKAVKKLNINKDDIKYTLKKEAKGLFSKKYIIEVTKEENDKVQKEKSGEIEPSINKNSNKKQPGEEVKTDDSHIILDKDDTNEYELYFDMDINIRVNNKKVINGVKVSSKDTITFNTETIEAQRKIKIDTTPMQALITTEYIPEYVGKVYCRKIDGNLRVKKQVEEGKKPPLYTVEEIKAALEAKNVVYGISEEALRKVSTEYDVKDVVVAEGTPVVDDEDDTLKLLFKTSKKKIKEDSTEKVDYRNNSFIANVSAGDKIAEIVIGKEGENGEDIFGNETPRKIKNTVLIKPGQGCKLEGNCFYSLIDGQPAIKSGMIHVHKVLQNPGDVDLKSGNIKFSGDVSINGSIKEGMTVECGNSLQVDGNVESATVLSQGETQIMGSIINSKIKVGCKNIEKQNYIEALEDMKDQIEKLMAIVMDIKERNLLGENATDGQIVKLLIESKFKNIPKIGLKILNGKGGKNHLNISKFIRNKIIGLGPLKIKFTSEINEFYLWIEAEYDELSADIFVPSDIHILYSQDSVIESTGNVYIDGKGEYVTDIDSKCDIVFTMSNSVARGGILKAKNIFAKTIGSSAGVATELRVPKSGKITADIVYQNVIFYFGDMKYVMEKASKEVKASVGKKGEIEVEKLLL